MVTEVESDPESVSGTGSPPKINQFFRLVGRIITQNESAAYFCRNHAHRQNERLADRQTDRQHQSYNSALALLAE